MHNLRVVRITPRATLMTCKSCAGRCVLVSVWGMNVCTHVCEQSDGTHTHTHTHQGEELFVDFHADLPESDDEHFTRAVMGRIHSMIQKRGG